MDKERDRRERELINDAIKLWASQYNEEIAGKLKGDSITAHRFRAELVSQIMFRLRRPN